MATDLQLSGLASGFDWKSLINQLMAVERVPIDRLNAEKTRNSTKSAALATLGSKMTALHASATALGLDNAFRLRNATSTTANSTWSASAGPSTAVGNYTVAVTRLATVAKREGAADIGQPLSPTADVSGTTLANLPIGTAITAGTFTVNGKQVTIALTDSLQSALDAIALATGNAVTAAYDPAVDRIVFSGSSEVVLGAANDTSNFLSALKLANNGTNTVASSSSLGAVKTTATLANANLAGTITAVDGAGDGSFKINGVSIAYNVNTDTLASVLTRINQSSAGVTASYDSSNDRVVLTNNTTGDVGVGLEETAGGLLDALGLQAGGTLVRGQNAQFTLNGGATLTSASNTLDATSHGIEGLAITVNSESIQTISVGSDTKSMRSRIDDFIAKFNEVQEYLESATRISTDSKGKVTAAVLADNREIQEWGSTLRRMAFGAIPGLPGVINRLDSLGIDFKAGTNSLEVKDSAKLEAALANKSADVDAFFHTASTGFAAQFKTFLTKLGTDNTTQQKNLTTANTTLDQQIADLERRLAQQRATMEAAFIAMESAQQKLQSQQAALTNAFFKPNT